MTRQRPGLVVLALVASLTVLTATSNAQQKPAAHPAATSNAQQKPAAQPAASNQHVPAEYQAGIAKLRVAKGYLEKAGDKWGGYRIKAIGSIDEALRALGVSPESTKNEYQTGNVDEPAMMNNAISNLQEAKADFGKAGNDWGGRKVKGLSYVDRALGELQQGIAYAKEHKTY